MAKKLLYPYAEELKHNKPIKGYNDYKETEPHILHTASGSCPNYDLFERLGYTTEQALVWCNMD